MPVNIDPSDLDPLFQREQYNKGGLGARYWDIRDRSAFQFIRPEDNTLLDLGCGEGITLERLHKTYPEKNVLGIDLMDENISICQSFGLNVQKGDLYQIPLDSDSVDVILFLEVLEHLHHPEKSIDEIFWNSYDRTFYWARIATLRFREAAYDPGHLFQWTPRILKRTLRNAGFSVQNRKNIPFFFWLISLHCVMVGEKPR